jgi:uncharacterized protein YbjT (DUF2867 family)
MTVLITGGTGTLGRQLVPLLDNAVVLSRTRGDRRGDLTTGAGLSEALIGVDTVVHLAAGKNQELETRNILAASPDVRHVVFMSIVGIDEIPFGYYRQKVAAEKLVLAHGRSSVLRSTQFHEFVNAPFAAQRRSPVVLTPKLRVQPIDVRVVAARLADLVGAGPVGRVDDLGGPEVLGGLEIARRYTRRRPIVQVSLPGKTFRAFRDGHHLSPNHSGGRTFAEFLAS